MYQRDAEEAWTRLAKRAVRKVNAGWWLEAFTPLAIGAGLVGFCVLFFLRSRWVEIDPAMAGSIGGVLLLLLAVTAWLFVRPRFRDADQGFVMLDARMKLRNALTTARSGHGPWPDLPLETRDGLHWRWQWLVAPLLVPAAFLVSALFIPVSPPEGENAKLMVKPPALADIENAVEVIEEEKLIDEEDLGRIKEALESLQQLPADEWYSHNNLEALDTMRAAMASNVQKLDSDMAKAAGAMAAFEKFKDDLPPSVKERLEREFDEALQGLNAGGMRANQQLRDALSKIDPSKLGQIDGDRLKQLRESLEKNRKGLQEMLGDDANGLSQDEQALRDLLAGEGKCPSCGGVGCSPGDGPGVGGINRGPGHAPTRLGDESDLGTKNLEGLESEDLTRSTLGATVNETIVEHEIDKTKVGPRAGGATDNLGSGGDAVWTNQLLPEERKVLERYFD